MRRRVGAFLGRGVADSGDFGTSGAFAGSVFGVSCAWTATARQASARVARVTRGRLAMKGLLAVPARRVGQVESGDRNGCDLEGSRLGQRAREVSHEQRVSGDGAFLEVRGEPQKSL